MNITVPGHLAPEIETLPNGGVVLLSKQSSRDTSIVLAKTKRDFVTWIAYTSEGEVVCEAGHYHGNGYRGLMDALVDYGQRR